MTKTANQRRHGGRVRSLWRCVVRTGAVAACGGLLVAAAGAPARALTIVPTFDSTWGSAPGGDLAAAEAAFASVDQLYASAFSNPVTVNIDVSWGSVGGSSLPGNALGATSVSYYDTSLGTIETLLTNDAAANPGNTALGTAVHYLPSSVSGPSFIIPAAEYEALTGTNLSGFQASIGFGTATNWQFSQTGGIAAGAYDFTAVAEHEIAHALGRVSYEFVDPVPYLTPMDIYRYDCGATTLNDSSGTTACFSLNGGTTDLQTFSDTSDSGDWYGPSGTGTDAYDAYLAAGVTATVTPVDYALLNALGYNPIPEPATVVLLGVGLASLGLIRRGRRRRQDGLRAA